MAKHKSGELRCPATALIVLMHCYGEVLLMEICGVLWMLLTMCCEQPNALLQHFLAKWKIFCNFRLVYQLKLFLFMEMLNTVDK